MTLRSALRALALGLLHRLELHRLRRRRDDAGPEVRRILSAVEGALRGRLNLEERGWVRRIEELRRELLASREVIALPDYGPGHSSVSDTTGESGYVPSREVGRQCAASKSPVGALLLFELVRHFRPVRALELGTSLGVSAAYQAAALELNGIGTLVTIEGAPDLARMARRHLTALRLGRAEVRDGRFGDVLPAILGSLEPLDYLFVDGHHDGPATLAYLDLIVPRLGDGALLVFDDVAWSSGMAAAWRAIQDDRRIRVAVDLGTMGICYVDRQPGTPVRVSLRVHT
jgi:predicted O-methyltransferase YrrM